MIHTVTVYTNQFTVNNQHKLMVPPLTVSKGIGSSPLAKRSQPTSSNIRLARRIMAICVKTGSGRTC